MDKQELFNYYITENHSREDTAKHFNIGVSKLKNILSEYGIKKDRKLAAKNNHSVGIKNRQKYIKDGEVRYFFEGQEEDGYVLAKAPILDRDTLFEEYITNNLSRVEIANKYNVLDYKVKNMLAEYGIKKPRSLSFKIRNKTINNKNTFEASIARVNKEDLIKYYIDENHSREECCEHFDVTMTNLKAIISEYKLPHKDRLLVSDTTMKVMMDRHGVLLGFDVKVANGYKPKDSKPNLAFEKELLDNNINDYSREFVVGRLKYNFKVGDILIEINPTATHNSTWSPFNEPISPTYHFEKTKVANDNGFRCIHIWDWDNKEAIMKLLLPRENVQARKCEVKEVHIKEAKEFINNNHIQGYARDNIRLGLFFENELISIMTFGKPRYNKNYEYELVRYCSSKNVVGGAEKLFKHFLEMTDANSVCSYCDNSKFNGDTYLKLGFRKVTKGVPTIHWYNVKSEKHITDNLLRQRGFDQLFGTDYGKGTSNTDLMMQYGFVKMYDCGQSLFAYKKSV